MNKTILKITLLALASIQAAPAHAMLARASHAALRSGMLRTSNPRFAAAAVAGMPRLQPGPTLLAHTLTTRANSSRSGHIKRPQDYRKAYAIGSIAAAAATYGYATSDAQTCFTNELPQTQETTQSRICDETTETKEHIPAQTEPYTYTINLMWINRKFEKDQEYIHPSKTLEELEKNLLNAAYEWAESNPQATIYVWYDSEFLTPEAIQNTQTVVDAYILEHPEIARIELKDARQLSEVTKHPEVFSDKAPVYFRADLLRLITTLHILKQSDARTYAVYADMDIKPMTKDELFDKDTLENIEFFGAVMDQETAYRGFENSFHIISNHKANLIQAIQTALITLNIERAYNALNGNFLDPWQAKKSSLEVLSEIVYYSYQRMFDYYCHLEGYGKLIVCPKKVSFSETKKAADANPAYSFSDHGHAPFGLTCTTGDETGFFFTLENETLIELKGENIGGSYVPTKKISRPPAKINYAFALPDSEQPLLSEKTKTMLTIGTSAVVAGTIAWWLS